MEYRMDIRHDAKGKYFTETVSKIQIQVIIQTTKGRIGGTVHVHLDHRLLDELNEFPTFLPVTNAILLDQNEEVKTEFMAVGKDMIVWVAPMEGIGGEDVNV